MLEPETRSTEHGEPERETPLRASDFLRANREALLSEWEHAMHALHAGLREKPSWLLDHMPGLLVSLADALDQGEQGPDTALADEHAVVRLDQGFDLGEVVAEYALLRKCILRRLEAQARPLEPGELERLEGALDRTVVRTVQRFAEERQRSLQALDRMAQATLDGPAVDTLLVRLLNVVMESTLTVDSAGVLMLEADRLVVRAAVGLGGDKALGSSLALGEGFVGEVAATRQPMTLRSASTDSRVVLPVLRDVGLRAVYGVPLVEGTRLLGVAYLGSRTSFGFSDADLLLFRTMCQRAAAYILQARLQDMERDARVEAQRSLALLDALLAASPLGMAFLDPELRYLRINQTLADINGFPPEAHLGRTLREMQPKAVADLMEPLLRRVLETGEPLQSFEFATPTSLMPPRGKRMWQVTFYPVREPQASGLLGLGCVLVDITHHKQTEASLQRAVDFREQLLAVLGHDLRNPLNAIGASAFQLARAEELEAPERRAVERIRKSAGRMGRMITDILDFARSKLGEGIPVSPQPMDLADVCQATLEELQVSHPGRPLLFESSGDTSGDWDPDRVAQVLGNLVSNALQHGGGDTPVHTRVRGEAHDVVLEVHNRGEPIPAELLPRIFDPFKTPVATSESASTYQKQRSLGLGLYIVHQIARAHGGRVEVRSSEEEGTTFRVYWPRAKSPPARV
ncbi:PAS domain-containing protein [Myxococcus sp. CA051A]|uniref:ATP-binding protein n=1 Tax=unclassified Myxococcus TaxID=2648731 RepID=UPI00157B11B8|nr:MULTISPECIES: ATP-binding protein [unclassified Myxococcus]NTX11020.1 PAS domain-containing protein [Myxococcus sp. CA056]NTX40883.1 PAS domain-containing protein [Myxococcus sp. CA033]NTX50474.1 PAS domain-containing protein [Myxococcus sp. CA039A]NTX60295.1 PAS domain-containing protein [Myxococcus sp. CA051A]